MSILDLVLEDNIAGHIVDKLEIDEYGDVLGGSDHAALFFSMRLSNNQQKRDGPQDNELFYQRTSCCLSILFQGCKKPGGRFNKSARNLLDKFKQVESGMKRLNLERLSGKFSGPNGDEKFKQLDQ